MDLILWRHAEAEAGTPDAERKLTPHGEEQAKKMAAWLRPRLPKNVHIICSPAKRTLQTAQALTIDFQISDKLGVGASVQNLLEVAGWPSFSAPVLLIGHEPTLGQVVQKLTESKNLNFERGMVCCLTSGSSQSWKLECFSMESIWRD